MQNDDVLAEGKSLYRQKEYSQALAFFLALPSETSADRIEIAYYLGLCYAKLEKYDDALKRIIYLLKFERPRYLNKEFIDELESCQEVSTVLDLDDTCKMMSSFDYKERFIAEYKQTKIRYEKLHKMIVKYEAGTLDFTPTCPIELLKEQASYMGKYLYILEVRAQLEGVNLNG